MGSQTRFLSFLSEGEKSPLLRGMTYRRIKAGERFLIQGEVAEVAYIIHRGSCLVVVEKEGEVHHVGHRGKGDIVGELSILTGEPQNAHVEAETDTDVWVLNKAQFDDISKQDPELLDFLTELVADRFDSKRPIADRLIGKYLATDIIGSGGYSIVYKGVHRDLNMPVAIKMMKHHLAFNPDFLNSFRNEAKTIASLNHENIIKVYDIEERFRTVFIIMELVEGESLKDMLQRLETIPPRVAPNLLVQICSGLAYAHGRGVLHLDVNPTNIRVQRDDRLKILDFGVACPPGSEDKSIFDGTVEYMAPEQIKCEPVDERADIYSLGITAYEMVTGKKPFEGERVKDVMAMHLTEGPPDPAEEVPDLSGPLRQFIMKACQPDPSRRYQGMKEALKDLLPLAGEYGPAFKARLSVDPIEILVREHALIRQFLDNLAIAASRLETEDRPPGEFFLKAIEFARSFTDRFHHFKEEHVMFAQLAQKKGGLLDGAIDSLRHQHERGRNFIREISSSLDGYARGDEIHTTSLLESLAAYIHLLRHHIHKEDHNFYQMVRREFSEQELEGLWEFFHEEDQKTGSKAFQDALRLVQEMGALL